MLLVSSLGIWAEEERESKSLRGVFPFSHVQQQDNTHSTHTNQHPNHRNHPIDSNFQDAQHDNRNTHSKHDIHSEVFHTHHEPETDEYYISKIDGVSTKGSSNFNSEQIINRHNIDNIGSVRALPNRDSRQRGREQDLNSHNEPEEDDYYISKVNGVSPNLSSQVTALPNRESRQGGVERDGFGEDIFIDLGAVAAAGERCIDKVVIVEETRYDDVIECKHSYTEKCHTTYITDFKPQQEEVCEENFVKNCFIEYKNIASEDTVKFCHTPLECVGEGPEECKTVYESECQTNYHEHDVEDDVVNCETIQEEKCEDVTQGYSTERKCTKWPVQKCNNVEKKKVKKYSPETNCKKVPRQLCGPSGCELAPGPEFCFDKVETVVQEVRYFQESN